MIGGTAAGAGNRIAFNGEQGVFIGGGTGWRILGNSIDSNTSLGISLSGGAPTPNDPGDGDTGANNLQNYPVLTGVSISASKTMAAISGTLNNTANATFRVEFFANAGCDDSGNGEGRKFIGFARV